MDGNRSPIHRAIDELTAVMLNLQRLDRHADAMTSDELSAVLNVAHRQLRTIGDCLIEIRDDRKSAEARSVTP